VTWRLVGQVVAVTGADWRSLMAMPPEMFADVVKALTTSEGGR
jgi:hypothetical protein